MPLSGFRQAPKICLSSFLGQYFMSWRFDNFAIDYVLLPGSSNLFLTKYIYDIKTSVLNYAENLKKLYLGCIYNVNSFWVYLSARSVTRTDTFIMATKKQVLTIPRTGMRNAAAKNDPIQAPRRSSP